VAAAGAFDTAGDSVFPGAVAPLARESGEAAIGLALDPGPAVDPTSVAVAGEAFADWLPVSPPTSSATPAAVVLAVVGGRNAAPMTIAPIREGSSVTKTTMTDRVGTIGSRGQLLTTGRIGSRAARCRRSRIVGAADIAPTGATSFESR
jgi:hypothetical protein